MADSLERLQMDYVDVVFCHRPDFTVPVEETVRTFNHLIAQGKCLYWGTSEWPAQRIQEAITCARQLGLIPPIVEQPQYNMLHRTRVEREYVTLYEQAENLGLTIWSPLASGILTGKYLAGVPEGSRFDTTQWLKESFEKNESMNGLEMTDAQEIHSRVLGLAPIAEALGCSRAQLALAWCLKNPQVTSVITGASCVAQVTENMKAMEISKSLNDEYMDMIDNILLNKPQQEKDWGAVARGKQATVAAQRAKQMSDILKQT